MGGPRGKKKVDSAKIEQYKEVCPPHKLKDLDALFKEQKGKDAAIREKIQEWWNEPEEPPTVEPEWESVDKKNAKKKQQQQQLLQQQQQSGRGGGRGSGRGGRGSYRGGGGRGSGPSERHSRSRRSPPPSKSPQPQEDHPRHAETDGAHDVPAPVVSAPTPKGAWGNRGVTTVPEPALPPPSPAKPVTPLKPEIPDKPVMDVGVVAPQDPTPSGLNASTPVRSSSTPGGNVWATKGSAHLIQAEKPKLPPPPTPPRQHMRLPLQSTEPPKSPVKRSLEPEPEPSAASTLDSGLSSTLSGMNTGSWNTSSAPPLEMTQPSSSVAEATLSSIGAPSVSVVREPSPAMSPAKPPLAPAPTNVLNMGHWEAGEGDESQNLDFGFGSFGPESATVEEPPKSKETTATMSPARPPPGLSIGGMPPMPANAVLVHELEGKLENTTLGKPEEQAEGPKPMTSNLPSQPPPSQPAAPSAPPGVMSQNYGTYAGMYSYNNAGQPSGFMGAPAGLGMPPQQKPQTGIPGQQAPLSAGGIPQHLQQQQPPLPPAGLYGSAPPSAGAPGVDSSTGPSSTENSTSGIPPGMPGAMPYNPALFYQQQPYQMGQPHGGVGYGYGYGAQFGGAAGFAYGQQVMGQSGGYPSYDDQPPQGRNDYPSKGNNRYPRNSGNQYQSQFNPQQHGGYGYGGQPMGGYNIDHFNQRGGYGHGPPADPYGMPQQQGISNYSGDKKGGRFQQHQQLGGGGQDQQQQNAFLGGNDTSSSSNHHQGGTGGWPNNSNNSNQGGGWGQPSAWQGGN